MGGICRRCGTSVKEEDKFCTLCGADLEKTRVDETQYRTQQAQQEQQPQQAGGTWQKQAPKNTEEALHKPLSFGDYLLLFLVLAIPILNIILLLVWSFSKEENTNRKNFARAALIYVIVISILQVFFFLWLMFFIMGIAVSMENDMEYHVEEVIPPDKIEEFLPDARNDLMITFTTFEEEKRNVEIGTDGITIL